MNRFIFAILVCLSASLSDPTYAGGAAVGEAAPAIQLPGLGESEAVTLESLAGKVVYVDFWASWCGPCRVSFPQLEEIRTELAGRGFEVLAVNVDEDQADALAFLREVPVSYPVVYDGEGATPQSYGILGMPTGYLVDRAGVVRDIHQGYKKSDGAKLRAAIIDLLGEDSIEISD